MKCQLDIGATVNVIGYKNLKDIFEDSVVRKSEVTIKAFGNFKIKPIGEIIVEVSVNDRKHLLLFQVMKFEHLPMLSNNIKCQRLMRYSRNYLRQRFLVRSAQRSYSGSYH